VALIMPGPHGAGDQSHLLSKGTCRVDTDPCLCAEPQHNDIMSGEPRRLCGSCSTAWTKGAPQCRGAFTLHRACGTSLDGQLALHRHGLWRHVFRHQP